MASSAGLNEDFNISSPTATTVLDLAELIWHKIKGDEPLRIAHDDPFEHDVQKRIPSVDKARDLIGFEAQMTLDEMLDELIPWIKDALDKNLL